MFARTPQYNTYNSWIECSGPVQKATQWKLFNNIVADCMGKIPLAYHEYPRTKTYI